VLSLLALATANKAGHASYLVSFALVVAVAACVLGISSSRRARREDTARPRGSVAAVILGVISIVLSLLAFVAIIYSRQLTTYEQCVRNATTNAAQQTCTRQLMHAIDPHYSPRG
jgi:uncharacterized membrane protein